MSRHEKICFRCKTRRATYSLQLMRSNQIRTKPGLCCFCALNQSSWNCPVKVFSDHKQYKNFTQQDKSSNVVIYRNPKAVSTEMKKIFSWDKSKFNRYILALSQECGFSAVLGHFFITRRRIRLFLASVVGMFNKFTNQNLLPFLKQAEDFADNSEEAEIDYYHRQAQEIIDINNLESLVDVEYSSNPSILDYITVALLRRGNIYLSSNALPFFIISKGEGCLKYLFYVFAYEGMQVDKKFITPDVKNLAEVAYNNRDWSAMPILADALQEAGCDSSMILKQCREGHHYRGCKILDSILGKS